MGYAIFCISFSEDPVFPLIKVIFSLSPKAMHYFVL